MRSSQPRLCQDPMKRLSHPRSHPQVHASVDLTASPAPEFGLLADVSQASALLYHPLRMRILTALLDPDSATGVARRMNLPRQTVNYHVRELARGKLLRKAGRRRRRHLYEQCYVATAQGYIFSPEILGKLAADPANVTDRFSAQYLLGLTSKVQSELSTVTEWAAKAGKRLSTFSINTELRFESADQRARFSEDLQKAVIEVVGRHSSPFAKEDGSPAAGRPFRLVLGCYPIPARALQEPHLEIQSGEEQA